MPEVTPSPSAAPSGAVSLLQFEAEVRQQATLGELRFHLVNEMRRVLRFRQGFALEVFSGNRVQVMAVSSLATVDADSGLVRWAHATLQGLQADAGLARLLCFDAKAYADPALDTGLDYPFTFLMWLPLQDRAGVVFAGALLADSQPWRQADLVIATRLGATYAHAWLALAPHQGSRWWLPPWRASRWWWLGAGTAAVGVLALPVRLSALAPVEVSPAQPVVLAAPIQGVIHKVHVAPNTAVKAGEVVLSFDDTRLRNELALAEQRLAVAQARTLRSSQAAFGSSEASHDVAINRAELDLATAERQYAADALARTRLTAPMDGVVVYSDRRDLEGRPVEIGQQLLLLADPSRVELRIELPARDSIVIADGALVTAYLDSAPLEPVTARLVRAGYQARPTADKVLAFHLAAEPAAETPLRIGSRGTAQVYGDRVPLVFKMLRRPLAALRQWVGL
jgi:multidrug efflux pump subunit AcrA (membrane-fusion protein)